MNIKKSLKKLLISLKIIQPRSVFIYNETMLARELHDRLRDWDRVYLIKCIITDCHRFLEANKLDGIFEYEGNSTKLFGKEIFGESIIAECTFDCGNDRDTESKGDSYISTNDLYIEQGGNLKQQK